VADGGPGLLDQARAAGLEQAQDSGHPGPGPRCDAVCLHGGARPQAKGPLREEEGARQHRGAPKGKERPARSGLSEADTTLNS